MYKEGWKAISFFCLGFFFFFNIRTVRHGPPWCCWSFPWGACITSSLLWRCNVESLTKASFLQLLGIGVKGKADWQQLPSPQLLCFQSLDTCDGSFTTSSLTIFFHDIPDLNFLFPSFFIPHKALKRGQTQFCFLCRSPLPLQKTWYAAYLCAIAMWRGKLGGI